MDRKFVSIATEAKGDNESSVATREYIDTVKSQTRGDHERTVGELDGIPIELIAVTVCPPLRVLSELIELPERWRIGRSSNDEPGHDCHDCGWLSRYFFSSVSASGMETAASFS